MKLLPLFLILILYSTSVDGFSCPKMLISDIATYSCTDSASSRILDSTTVTIPSGQTALTLSFNIQITTICGAYDPAYLLVLAFGASGSQKRLMNFIWKSSTKQVIMNTEKSAGSFYSVASNTEAASIVNNWISVALTLDVSTGYIAGALYSPSTFNAFVPSPTTAYSWTTLDPTTVKMSICADIDGTSILACQINNLNLIYTSYSSARLPLVMGTAPILYGVYSFTEGSGYYSDGLLSSMGRAYFGASTDTTSDTTNSPSWLTTGAGIQFTSRSQYVSLPNFIPDLINNHPNSWSYTVMFWVKPAAYAASASANDTIFTYKDSTMTTTKTSVALNSAGKIVATVGNFGAAVSTSVISTTAWTQVIARISCVSTTADVTSHFGLNFGSTDVFTPNRGGYGAAVPAMLSSDVVRLGGFLGKIGDLRIFTPNAIVVNSPTCSTTCPFDMGNTNPPTCFLPTCSQGEYSTGQCVNCPTICATCTDTGNCQTCKPGYMLSGTTCVQCPAGTYSLKSTSTTCAGTCQTACATCTSSTSCATCPAGYIRSSGTCTQCTGNTYSASSTATSCTTCPTGCATCTSGTSCQTCQSTYIISGGVCSQCTGATYSASSTATSCTACPTGCATCTSGTSCQTCQATYIRSSGTCSQCTGNTYSASSTATSCSTCPTGCATCSSGTSCQTCQSTYIISGGVCSQCTGATYSPSSTATSCTTCPTGCATCTSGTSCQTCQATYALTSGVCGQCTGATYSASSTATSCTACPTGCATCSSSSACPTCLTGYIRSGGTCSQCTGNTYSPSSTATTCSTCPTGCATCTSSSSCQTCQATYALTSGVCSQCTGSTYSASSTATSCTACPTGCATCTSASSCQTCLATYLYSSGTCTQCPTEKFLASPTDTSCTNCPTGCATCSSLSTCQSCITNYIYIIVNNTCTACPAGKYSASSTATICTTCPQGCATCTRSACQTCKSGFDLQNSMCIPQTKSESSHDALIYIIIGAISFILLLILILIAYAARRQLIAAYRRFFGKNRPLAKIAPDSPQIKPESASAKILMESRLRQRIRIRASNLQIRSPLSDEDDAISLDPGTVSFRKE